MMALNLTRARYIWAPPFVFDGPWHRLPSLPAAEALTTVAVDVPPPLAASDPPNKCKERSGRRHHSRNHLVNNIFNSTTTTMVPSSSLLCYFKIAQGRLQNTLIEE
mmetsp:Transcript_21143/g.44626  ORF Transcript_21143/g.44626 Transcript_21143/m.44626 type:complete len:106 (-) Transcript_21143:1025-1342(-)